MDAFLPSVGSSEICPTLAVPKFQLSLVSTNARANPESGPKLPIVSLRLPTSRQKTDQGWSLEALNWDNYVAHVQIIGGWTRNPVWLTLIGLIIGEIVMGIPGMILAPVVLNYVRVEMSKIEVPPAST